MSLESDKMEAMFSSLDDSNNNETRVSLRPPMCYAGNKFKQLDFILPLLPWHNTYCEVFGGSGAVLLNKNPSKLEVFNDRFSGSVAFYKCLQDETKMQQLVDKISLMPHAREFYTWCHETWKLETDDVERASRWYYAIQMSFGGVGRTFGRPITNTNSLAKKFLSGIPLFPEIHARLKNVLIENLDFRQCFDDFDSPDTCFYCDPPYYGSDIYLGGFTKADHIDLCARVFRLQGACVVSGFENPIYDQFSWDSVHLNDQVDNRINGISYHANEETNELPKESTRKEYLWIKEAN